MSDKDWDRFFTLVDKIVELPLPLDEKIQLVVDKSKEQTDTVAANFEDFMAWDFGGYFES